MSPNHDQGRALGRDSPNAMRVSRQDTPLHTSEHTSNIPWNTHRSTRAQPRAQTVVSGKVTFNQFQLVCEESSDEFRTDTSGGCCGRLFAVLDAADEDCVAYVYQVGRDGTLRKPYSLKCPPTPDLVEHVQWRFGAGEYKLKSSFAGAAPWSVPPSLRWQARSRDHRLPARLAFQIHSIGHSRLQQQRDTNGCVRPLCIDLNYV